jgi:tRNA threonylcarbamoyladenosine biosynthesis protein TsaE
MNGHSISSGQHPHTLEYVSLSADHTIHIGHCLGEQLQPGDLVLLMGALGVGKTQLVRGIVHGLGSTDLVTSPSFVLINEYQAEERWQGMSIFHADLYRLHNPAELDSIGLAELWGEQDVCLVEWAERAETWLPDDYLTVHMEYLDENRRQMRFLPQGERYQRLVEALRAEVLTD